MSPVFFHLSLLDPFFPASLISLGPKTKAVQTAAWTEINKKKQKLFFIIYPHVSWQEGRRTGVLIDSRCAGPHSQLHVLFFQRDSFFLSAETKAGNIDAGYGSRHAAAACVCACVRAAARRVSDVLNRIWQMPYQAALPAAVIDRFHHAIIKWRMT